MNIYTMLYDVCNWVIYLQKGDVVECEIEKIGLIRNEIV